MSKLSSFPTPRQTRIAIIALLPLATVIGTALGPTMFARADYVPSTVFSANHILSGEDLTTEFGKIKDEFTLQSAAISGVKVFVSGPVYQGANLTIPATANTLPSITVPVNPSSAGLYRISGNFVVECTAGGNDAQVFLGVNRISGPDPGTAASVHNAWTTVPANQALRFSLSPSVVVSLEANQNYVWSIRGSSSGCTNAVIVENDSFNQSVRLYAERL